MSPETRLKVGVALLILGLIMPAGTLVVAATDWPVAVKTVLSGILLFGFEIMIIPAVALMGNRRERFDTSRHIPTFSLDQARWHGHNCVLHLDTPGHGPTASDSPFCYPEGNT